MRVRVIVVLTMSFIFFHSAFCQEENIENPRIGIDFTAGIGCGVFCNGVPEIYNTFEPAIASALSIKLNFDGSILYKINDSISIGPSIGVNYLKSVYNNTDYIYADIPIRLACKYGKKNTFLQPFVGYYWCITSFMPSGIEIGSRISLAGFFIEASEIFGKTTWTHVNIGAAIPII